MAGTAGGGGLRLTFLGHQGWHVEGGGAVVLIDPLLGPSFGTVVQLPLHPPREVDVGAMPTPDLVLITHEHNDHLDLRSLARLPAGTPVGVGPLFPTALAELIAELGLAVHTLALETPYRAGALEVELLPGGQGAPLTEQRVTQVRVGLVGAPWVLVCVDTLISAHTLDRVARGELDPPALAIVANNSQRPPPGARGAHADLAHPVDLGPADGHRLLQELVCDGLAGLPGPPAVALCGGGFIDPLGLRAPFCFSDHPALAAAAQALDPRRRVFGPLPGQVLELRGSEILVREAPWVRRDEAAHAALDARLQALIARPEPAPPLAAVLPPGPAAQAPARLARLDAHLDALAAQLLGSPLGEAVLGAHRWRGAPVGPHRVALQLPDAGGGPAVQRLLDVRLARFVPGDLPAGELPARIPCGAVVHLDDLLGLFDGELLWWDLGGLALHHWSPPGSGGLPRFLCLAFGEGARPELAARVHRRVLDDIQRRPPGRGPG
jgi:hypothetical protein